MAVGRVSRWKPDVIRAELEAFLGDRTDWPTAHEFTAAGREDLRTAVKRHGGATYWANELGKSLRPKQERSPYGEAEALRDAKAVAARVGHLPGEKTLRSMGYHRLATHIAGYGGGRKYARIHGLRGPRPPRV